MLYFSDYFWLAVHYVHTGLQYAEVIDDIEEFIFHNKLKILYGSDEFKVFSKLEQSFDSNSKMDQRENTSSYWFILDKKIQLILVFVDDMHEFHLTYGDD